MSFNFDKSDITTLCKDEKTTPINLESVIAKLQRIIPTLPPESQQSFLHQLDFDLDDIVEAENYMTETEAFREYVEVLFRLSKEVDFNPCENLRKEIYLQESTSERLHNEIEQYMKFGVSDYFELEYNFQGDRDNQYNPNVIISSSKPDIYVVLDKEILSRKITVRDKEKMIAMMNENEKIKAELQKIYHEIWLKNNKITWDTFLAFLQLLMEACQSY